MLVFCDLVGDSGFGLFGHLFVFSPLLGGLNATHVDVESGRGHAFSLDVFVHVVHAGRVGARVHDVGVLLHDVGGELAEVLDVEALEHSGADSVVALDLDLARPVVAHVLVQVAAGDEEREQGHRQVGKGLDEEGELPLRG